MRQRSGDFTLRQLATFVSAARTGSFALAADQLGISRTTLRLKIKSLRNGHEGDETPL